MDDLELMDEGEWRPRLHITFIVESAVDTGGPMREFFSLFYAAAQSRLTRGDEPFSTFTHHLNALNKRKFFYFGKLVAIAILNGCAGPTYFSDTLTRYILLDDFLGDCDLLIQQLPVGIQNVDSVKESIALVFKSLLAATINNTFMQNTKGKLSGCRKHHKERLFRGILDHCCRPDTKLSIDLVFKIPLAATINVLVYWFMQNMTTSLKLIATVT